MCEVPYEVDAVVSDELWGQLYQHKEGEDKHSGLLCPHCIIDELEKKILSGDGSAIEIKIV